jgi:murein DD-endopeptidase MepM/ murein hydrolase activator NlpD
VDGRDYVFMHLSAGSILVAPGQHVGAGQPIAQVGRTGRASGPHLHFEIWVGGWYDGGEPIDPLPDKRKHAAQRYRMLR